MVSTTPLGLLSSSMLILMQIGQVIWLAGVPSQVFASCWALFLSPGIARSKTWFSILVLRLYHALANTTVELVWLWWLLTDMDALQPTNTSLYLIISVLSTLFIMMSFMNAPSTLRSIATSLAIISRKTISSCTPSPLPTN